MSNCTWLKSFKTLSRKGIKEVEAQSRKVLIKDEKVNRL